MQSSPFRHSSAVVSLLAALVLALTSFGVFSTEALAQIPVINQPLVPDSTVPEGPQFTLTVNGTGFWTTSVVNWNGDALATQFVNGSQLTATVPAADIATASTASVTVTNPGDFGGTSSVLFFAISTPPTPLLFGPAFLLASNSPTSVAAGDFNGDGKPDLAVASLTGGTVSVLHGDGDGSFQPPVVYDAAVVTGPPTLPSGPTQLVTGDFSGSGKTDVATYVTYARDIGPSLWALLDNETIVDFQLGDAPGNLGAESEPMAAFGGSLAVGGYGYVGGNLWGNTVSICGPVNYYYDWSFLCQPPLSVGSVELGYLVAGDFNGDGNLDLAVANPTQNTVSILLGGNFTLGSIMATGVNPVAIGVGDFNGDGKLDLAVVNNGSSTVSILLGDGTGNFTLASSPATGSNPVSVAVGDFNGDGKLDLAVANEGSNTVSILLGDGTGNFTLAASPATGLAPVSVAVGDFNGDGRLDLAVGNSGDNTVSILLQSTTVTVSPSTGLSFGTQVVGTASVPQTLTLTNTGSANLTLSTLAVSGDFTQTDTCGSSLIAGESCTISVTFTPTQAGTRTGTITITDNAVDGPQIVSLTGTGAAPAVALSATSLTFSSQGVGTTSAAQTVTLTNTGSAALTITSFAVSGDFAETNTCGGSVAAGKSCTISVSFTPTAPGTRTGTMTVTDNAAGSPQIVSLTGTGAGPAATLSVGNLTFNSQALRTASAAQSATLTNTGNAVLRITGLAAAGDFTETNTCGGSVAAGKSCTVSVTFTPTASGTRTGTITINDNAPSSPQIVNLTGTGTAPAAILSASTMSVGSQGVGAKSSAHTITLTNSGNGALTIAGITASGDFSETNTCSSSLAAGASCTISVTFTPTAAGTRTGTITITDNAPGSPHLVSLTGTGTGPAVSLNASTMSVGGQVVGTTSAAHKLTLTNTGNAALSITGMTLSSASFSETNTCGSSLAVGANCTITVTFTPSVAGEISGVLSITDNASGSPHQVTLSGMGQDFTIGPFNLAHTTPAGLTTSYDLEVSPEGGFNQPVSLACSGAPQHASCSVTPASMTLDGRNHAVITLRIATTAPAASPNRAPTPPPSTGRWGLPVNLFPIKLLALILAMLLAALPLAAKSRMASNRIKPLQWLVPIWTLLLLTAVWAGCGGGSGFVSPPATAGTPAGDYVVTVTATSGSLTHAITVKLTVH